VSPAGSGWTLEGEVSAQDQHSSEPSRRLALRLQLAGPIFVSLAAGLGVGAQVYGNVGLRTSLGPTELMCIAFGLVGYAALGAYAVWLTVSRGLGSPNPSNERELEQRVAQLSSALESALHDARHDPLTGLPNRGAMLERLAHAIAHARRYDHGVVMMLVDLDRFQRVNDLFGNVLADRALREIGLRVARVSRASDVAGRLGGDVFGLVLFGAHGIPDASATVTQLRRSLARPVRIDGRDVVLPASIGIAFFPTDARDEHELLRRAELALSAAKESGGDCIHFFEPTLHQIAQGEMEIERELRLAIERKEFVLHFQPQLDLANLRVVGAEALIRWEHPERGCLAPFHFLSVAERTGLIAPIGSWVIQAVCEQRARWDAEGLPRFPVALNVSAEQFASGHVASQLRQALESLQMNGNEIHCEVTETCMIRKAQETLDQLEELRQLGARIALDDFGTGYSSLTTLSKFPIDVIKIDRSFVSGIGSDPKKLSIVAGIVALAESLGLDTVAEGIETEDELALVRDLGCARGQGYLFSKPLPVADFELWVRGRAGSSEAPV